MLNGTTMIKIMNDVRGEIPADKSTLKYDEEMLSWRAGVAK